MIHFPPCTIIGFSVGISLVHLAGAFEWRRFGVFRVDCGMYVSYCVVHLKSGHLGYRSLFGVGMLYPGALADCIRQLAVFMMKDSAGAADAADLFCQQ